MAPEMLEGRGLDRPTIDYWAVGVILFELIVGIPPFNDESVEKVFQKILNNDIPWADLEAPEGEEEVMSQEAKSLITGLLEPNPYERLGSDGIDDIKSHPFFYGSRQ